MPLYSEKELEELYYKNKEGDPQAKEKLISFNLPLVHALCRRYPAQTVGYEDIFQEGCIGLLKALQKYDPEKGAKFSTYAVPFILGNIKACLRQNGHLLKFSRSHYAHFYRFLQERDNLEQALQRKPHLEEIAAKMGLPVEEIILLTEMQQPTVPLTDEVSGTLISGAKNQGFNLDKIFNHIVLQEKLQILPPREKQIIVLRYFLEKSQEETAQILGLSQRHISRLEKKAMEMLKKSR
ncbi:MAG: sigma-70 family RNA polymerase sigma factor [Firmicutes bacterium]|nr:sigma-70 family RNA polymerase sigma factor [Bacillota bacterium]